MSIFIIKSENVSKGTPILLCTTICARKYELHHLVLDETKEQRN